MPQQGISLQETLREMQPSDSAEPEEARPTGRKANVWGDWDSSAKLSPLKRVSAVASVGASKHSLRGCHRQPAPSSEGGKDSLSTLSPHKLSVYAVFHILTASTVETKSLLFCYFILRRRFLALIISVFWDALTVLHERSHFCLPDKRGFLQ